MVSNLLLLVLWSNGDVNVLDGSICESGFWAIIEQQNQKIAAFGSSYNGWRTPCRSCRRLRSFDLGSSKPTKSPPKGGLCVFTALSEQPHLRRFFFQRLVLRRLFVPATAQG